jgi:hypothetical protein
MVDYEKYVVREPLREVGAGVKNRQSPTMTFLSKKQVPEVNTYVQFGWIYDVPDPNPHIHEHTHQSDEIVLHIGGDVNNPEDLGGEIEFYVGGQPLTFATTTGLFIPAGVPHGPVTWKRVNKPHLEMTILLNSRDPFNGLGMSGDTKAKGLLPQKTDNVDYERYLVRKPVYEQGPPVKNRQHPTMTYMSRQLVPEANHYIEFGWIYGMPEPNPHIFEMTHNFDEVVFHIGGDPHNPLDLGAEIEFYLGDRLLSVNTTHGEWIPRGVKHGPETWKSVSKPHIEMAILLNCGDLKEGWGDSGIYEGVKRASES